MVRHRFGYVEGAFYNRYSYIFMNKVVEIMKYEKPMMDVVCFEAGDIIRTSGEDNDLESGTGGGGNIDPYNY